MKRVFIVHGHDLQLRDKVRDLISSLGLEPVILSDQPNQGSTVIEKFERDAGSSDYAIVLLTGDDLGAPTSTLTSESQEFSRTLSEIIVGLSTPTLPPVFKFTGFATGFKESMEMSKQMQEVLMPLVVQMGKFFQVLHPRARQNVTLELGFFIGHIGRRRVCVLAAPDVELPSDISGIATISTADNWQPVLLKELQAVGML